MVNLPLTTLFSSRDVFVVLTFFHLVLPFINKSTVVATDEENSENCGRTAYSRWSFKGRKHFWIHGQRLVGGSSSIPNAYPWTAQVLWATGRHCCGAALIDSEFIVSAAHCFAKYPGPDNYKLFLGGYRFRSGTEHSIVNITIHPSFNIAFPSAYDIAVVRFEPSANFSDSIRKICLPKVAVAENRTCVVTGWGYEKEKGECSTVLKEIKVPILDDYMCNEPLYYNGRIYPLTMMCAGYKEGGIDACQGDSGGPLFCSVGKRWELHGLVSWGVGCARPNKPGVYTKIVSLVPWIQAEIDDQRKSMI